MSARSMGAMSALLVAILLSVPVALQGQGDDRSFAMGITYWPPTDSAAVSSAAADRLAPITENSDIVQVILRWCPGWTPGTRQRLEAIPEETQRLGLAIDWLADDRGGVRCGRDEPWSFSDTAATRDFVALAADLVRRYRPEYMVLGVEVDYYAVTALPDFPFFVSAYIQARDTIKDISPGTLIGLSFQYTHSRLVSDSSSTLLGTMAEIFGNVSDFIGVSVYPFQRGVDPAEFSADYFGPLRELNVPVAIIETGWPGSSGAQERYTAQLLRASDEVGIKLVVWTSATDIPARFLGAGTPSWAAEIGLWNLGQVPKPSLSVWRSWLARSWSWRP